MTTPHPLVFGRVPARRVRRVALIVGIAWLASCALGWLLQPAAFYRCYLTAWLFWLGITLGAMAIVMLHHLMGGRWGIMIRRLGEHAAMTVPLLIVLFIPIIIGIRSLYIWSRPEALVSDALLRYKAPYLNVGFFLLRAAIYAVFWFVLAWHLRRRSFQFDRDGSQTTAKSLLNVSAGGMLFYFLTMSLASVDWLMSREPHWYSTVFGLMVICGQAISGLCFLIIVFALLADTPPFAGVATPDHFNDLGNLLLTTVILWSYLAFVQFLVIWMTNKQDEIPWYVRRLSGGWVWVGLGLVVLHFFVPFIVLLMRDLKRKAPVMLVLCAGLLVLRAVDMFWMVGPSEDAAGPLLSHVLSWMDFVFPIGMGGLWVAFFLWLVEGHPLMPRDATNATAPVLAEPA